MRVFQSMYVSMKMRRENSKIIIKEILLQVLKVRLLQKIKDTSSPIKSREFRAGCFFSTGGVIRMESLRHKWDLEMQNYLLKILPRFGEKRFRRYTSQKKDELVQMIDEFSHSLKGNDRERYPPSRSVLNNTRLAKQIPKISSESKQ